MSKPIHYNPTGQASFCRDEGAIDAETAFKDAMAGRTSTDLRVVTCPLCLHAVAASMIRKGVPIKFTAAGKTFYEHFIVKAKPEAKKNGATR